MTAKSHKLGPGYLKFGATGTEAEFSTRCREVAIEPDIDEEDPLAVLSGDEVEGDETESYAVTGVILQDYDLNSLLVWAHVHAGQILKWTFRPDNDKALGATGFIKVRRIKIGGEVKTRNESDFEFPGRADPAVPGAPVMYDLLDMTTGEGTKITTWTAAGTSTPDDGSEWF